MVIKAFLMKEKFCQMFNTFFSNVVSNLDVVSLMSRIRISNLLFLSKEPPLKEEVIKVIRNSNVRKSCQTTDIPTKVIKLNSDSLAKFIYKHFNYCIDRGEFPNELKDTDLSRYIRKTVNETKKAVDL